MTDSEHTPAPVALDPRQQPFPARLANACEGSKPKRTYNHPMSGAPICRVIKTVHEHGPEAETMCWPNMDEELAIKMVVLSDDYAAKWQEVRWVSERETKVGRGQDVVD